MPLIPPFCTCHARVMSLVHSLSISRLEDSSCESSSVLTRDLLLTQPTRDLRKPVRVWYEYVSTLLRQLSEKNHRCGRESAAWVCDPPIRSEELHPIACNIRFAPFKFTQLVWKAGAAWSERRAHVSRVLRLVSGKSLSLPQSASGSGMNAGYF